MRVDWKTDISMLMEDELSSGASPLASKNARQFVDLVAHNRSELSVLKLNLSGLNGSNVWIE
jgi:hypothetical protein